MRKIGLLGGMSWESTAVYYRLINEALRAQRGGLASADILMRSLDFQTIVDLQRADRWDEAAKKLAMAAHGLEKAGADCILICTNTMHLCADAVQDACDVPLIHIIDETAGAIRKAGHRRPLLLATRYTMEHGFYAERMWRHDLQVVIPDHDDRLACHNAIFDELCQGRGQRCHPPGADRHDGARQGAGRGLRHSWLHRTGPERIGRRPAPALLRFDPYSRRGGGRIRPRRPHPGAGAQRASSGRLYLKAARNCRRAGAITVMACYIAWT